MNKVEIRKQQGQRKMALGFEEVTKLSEKLRDQFATLNFEGVETAHFFLPIQENKEPDTFMLIKWLKENHPAIKILVPKADFTTFSMTHHPYQGKEYLKKSLFNILEPVLDVQHTGRIDMVVVPLLAFDLQGYRVGYGKGFYDRFLKGMDTIKVGLSIFESVDTIVGTHENDVRLDLCITPERIVYFNS